MGIRNVGRLGAEIYVLCYAWVDPAEPIIPVHLALALTLEIGIAMTPDTDFLSSLLSAV